MKWKVPSRRTDADAIEKSRVLRLVTHQAVQGLFSFSLELLLKLSLSVYLSPDIGHNNNK